MPYKVKVGPVWMRAYDTGSGFLIPAVRAGRSVIGRFVSTERMAQMVEEGRARFVPPPETPTPRVQTRDPIVAQFLDMAGVPRDLVATEGPADLRI